VPGQIINTAVSPVNSRIFPRLITRPCINLSARYLARPRGGVRIRVPRPAGRTKFNIDDREIFSVTSVTARQLDQFAGDNRQCSHVAQYITLRDGKSPREINTRHPR